MRDKELYRKILGIEAPWSVVEVELKLDEGEVLVHLKHGDRKELRCPECGESAQRYDTRPRRWRHLDTCQYRTLLVAEVPRIECAAHGVRQIQVPWG